MELCGEDCKALPCVMPVYTVSSSFSCTLNLLPHLNTKQAIKKLNVISNYYPIIPSSNPSSFF